MYAMEERIHLDNLEEHQNAYLYKGSQISTSRRHIDLAPYVNSPRSLRACSMCNIDPDTVLVKVSLQEHFEWVVSGAIGVNRSEPTGVNLRAALDACREAGIINGSTTEKLQAFRNYMDAEAARLDTLELVQEVRRQLIAEETFARRRRAHMERSAADPSATTEARTRGSVAESRKTTATSLHSEWGARLDCLGVLPIDKRDVSASLPGAAFEFGPAAAKLGERAPSSSAAAAAVVAAPVPPLQKSRASSEMPPALANVQTSWMPAKTLREREAPPAPPISQREQSEVFYYYCANATAPGRVSDYRENSFQ